MTIGRAVTGLIAALVALAVLAPLPAAAQAVSTQAMVCADVNFGPFSVVQNAAKGTVALKLGSPGGVSSISMALKGLGLPPNSPSLCALLCVVDGDLDLFNFELFLPCGNTNNDGKLVLNTTIPFSNFDGGCLLAVPAYAVFPAAGPDAVVCAPGFGAFTPFIP